MAPKQLSTNNIPNAFQEAIKHATSKSRVAMQAIYTYVTTLQQIVNNKDTEQAAHELGEFRRQTDDALVHGRSLNPIIKDFADAVRTYKIDMECIEALYESLYMDTTHSSYSPAEYKKYILGMGEAVGLMVLRVLCYKRAVVFHKLTPAGRALGAAICKVNLLQDHGRVHKRHGRMHFPEVTKQTFNQARLAQIIVGVEADFRVARTMMDSLPPGTKTVVAYVYLYHYNLLRQMRSLSPAQIDAGQAKISSLRGSYISFISQIAPTGAVQRTGRY